MYIGERRAILWMILKRPVAGGVSASQGEWGAPEDTRDLSRAHDGPIQAVAAALAAPEGHSVREVTLIWLRMILTLKPFKLVTSFLPLGPKTNRTPAG